MMRLDCCRILGACPVGCLRLEPAKEKERKRQVLDLRSGKQMEEMLKKKKLSVFVGWEEVWAVI